MEEAAEKRRWSLEGMTALVTGGTKGIGHAIVEELAGLGASVHTCSRKEAEVNQVVREWTELGFRVTGSVCDVTVRAQREKLMEDVSNIFKGKLNIFGYTEDPIFRAGRSVHRQPFYSFFPTNGQQIGHLTATSNDRRGETGNGVDLNLKL